MIFFNILYINKNYLLKLTNKDMNIFKIEMPNKVYLAVALFLISIEILIF